MRDVCLWKAPWTRNQSQHLRPQEEYLESWCPPSRCLCICIMGVEKVPRRNVWSHGLPPSLSFHICIMGVEKLEQPPRVWHS